MKQIRRGVFETNSSSSHSITITKWEPPKVVDIPRNYEEIFEVYEFGDVDGGEDRYGLDTHLDEVSKLRFIVNMLARVYEDLEWDDDTFEWGNLKFYELIKQDLFVWLKEAVKEETGTEIAYIHPKCKEYPYFEATYSEYDDMKDLLHIEKDGDGFNKEKFKARVKEIIFNKEIVIYNEECPYGMERIRR
ncbi:MAG: hypothetical protein IJX99_00840 [Clostridia bacterium]|nr:hypothetical protein [Clostridia bacterium]